MTTFEEITYEDILDHKHLINTKRLADLDKLKKWNALENERKFCGNVFLYHHQIANMLETKRGNHPLLREIMEDETLRDKLKIQVEKRQRTGTLANRIFECYRVNTGAVVFFKPSTAKFLYQKYKCSHILDFTAGWGGRMLGAWSLGIGYTGIDTNLSMKSTYDNMLIDMNNPSNIRMIWNSCLNVDLSAIDYDFVLTSPPYVNMEVYQHMTPFENRDVFYKDFLITMIDRCRTHIKRNGKTAINISPQMYEILVNKYHYEPCHEEYDLLQQKRAGKNKGDKIYLWNAL